MPLHFELVSPAKLLFSGDVASVAIPGSEGDMIAHGREESALGRAGPHRSIKVAFEKCSVVTCDRSFLGLV